MNKKLKRKHSLWLTVPMMHVYYVKPTKGSMDMNSFRLLAVTAALSILLATLVYPKTQASTNKLPSDLTGYWQLFVDDYLVENKQNVIRTYHPFIKSSHNPVLPGDKPWEGNVAYVYGTVLPDEEGNGYRMWYHVYNGGYLNLYATSRDGINWIKPELGQVSWKNSTDNNILDISRVYHLPQVIHTPWEEDRNKHYKMTGFVYGVGFCASLSPDGIHWTPAQPDIIFEDPGDVGNFVWDPHTQRYTGYPKAFAPVRGYRRRCVGFTATPDFRKWPSTQLILVPDEFDDRWVIDDYDHTDFYGLSAFAYESGYIGLLWIFPITNGVSDGPVFCELVSSRDGINWVRQDPRHGGRGPILPCGPDGSWDDGMVYTTNHPLVEDGVIKLWYGGFAGSHSARLKDRPAGVGLATLRKDGFASLDSGDYTGTVTTKLLKKLTGQLYVNANAKQGLLKVEVFDSDGRTVPGYSRDHCQPINSDGIEIPVRWQKHNQLPTTAGPLRLRFVMNNTSLYSFKAGQNVSLQQSNPPLEIKLNFEDAFPYPAARYITHTHSLTNQGSQKPSPYVVLEPNTKPAAVINSLLIFLYGAGGSHTDYNLMRKPYEKLRQHLASRGYYILIPELGPSHWMNDRAKLLLDRMVEQTMAEYQISPQHVHIMGTSMGGGSALAYAIHRPYLIRSACSVLAMTDFTQWFDQASQYRSHLEKAYNANPKTNPQAYNKVSAMANLDAFSNTPVFLISGKTDRIVSPDHSKQFHAAIKAKGYYSVYRENKNAGHTDQAVEPYQKQIADFFDQAVDNGPKYILHNSVTIIKDRSQDAQGNAAAFTGKGDTFDKIEITNTSHLGPQFTLAAMVKTTNKKNTCLFSTHRGEGTPVTGELLFDFDPAAGTVRMILNGQTLKANTSKFDDNKYHHLAATYDRGHVTLYLDGAQVADKKLKHGAAAIQVNQKIVKRHFDYPIALDQVGIHLGGNICIGEDTADRFNYYGTSSKNTTHPIPSEQLVGYVDDVLVLGYVLSPAELQKAANSR